MTPQARRPLTPAVRLAIGPVLLLGLAACGSDADQHSAGNYCTKVGDHLSELDSPELSTQADIDVMLDAWRSVADTAPLAIEREWGQLLRSMETASTVDPNDPDSVKLALDTARESEAEANAIIDYTYRTCNAVIGGVAPVTLPPSSTTPTTGDTVPGGTAPTDAGATSTTGAPLPVDTAPTTPGTGA